jgi:hypothetical protein
MARLVACFAVFGHRTRTLYVPRHIPGGWSFQKDGRLVPVELNVVDAAGRANESSAQ